MSRQPGNSLLSSYSIDERERAVYARLYDAADARMREAGGALPVKKEVWLATVAARPEEADLRRTESFQDKDFVQAASKLMLHRYPTEKELADWMACADPASPAFRQTVVNTISALPRVAMGLTEVRGGFADDVYTENAAQSAGKSASLKKTVKRFLYRLYLGASPGMQRLMGRRSG